MTVEVPPTEPVAVTAPETTTTAIKEANKATEEPTTVTTAVIEKTDEPTLTTQIEPPSAETEEAQPSSATEEKPKRKGLFNNPFANKVKKDSEEAVTTLNDAAEASENKITKGFGNFLSKVKQTASSNNIKELSEPTAPTTTTILVEGENAPETENVHENATTATETPTATTPDQTNNKRQSILSKLFGGGANKKKEEEAAHEETTDREVTVAASTAHVAESAGAEQHQQQQTEADEPSSPPLSRRVTGFFAKKIPKLDKKTKSTDKVDTTEDKTVEEQAPTPTVEHAPTPTVDEETPAPPAHPVPAVEEAPVVKVTESAPPAPTDTPVAPAAATTNTTNN